MSLLSLMHLLKGTVKLKQNGRPEKMFLESSYQNKPHHDGGNENSSQMVSLFYVFHFILGNLSQSKDEFSLM